MKDLGGGAVLDLGIYMLQLVQFVYKEPPTDIVCSGHLSKLGVDESVSCALKFRDGRTATVAAHTRATMPNRAEIIGTKGTISVRFPHVSHYLMVFITRKVIEYLFPQFISSGNFYSLYLIEEIAFL